MKLQPTLFVLLCVFIFSSNVNADAINTISCDGDNIFCYQSVKCGNMNDGKGRRVIATVIVRNFSVEKVFTLNAGQEEYGLVETTTDHCFPPGIPQDVVEAIRNEHKKGEAKLHFNCGVDKPLSKEDIHVLPTDPNICS